MGRNIGSASESRGIQCSAPRLLEMQEAVELYMVGELEKGAT